MVLHAARRHLSSPMQLTEQQRASHDRITVWAFIWTLFAFKAITALMIWWAVADKHEANVILSATHWFFLFVPIFAIAGTAAYQYRLRRVRRRRLDLQRSEWMID